MTKPIINPFLTICYCYVIKLISCSFSLNQLLIHLLTLNNYLPLEKHLQWCTTISQLNLPNTLSQTPTENDLQKIASIPTIKELNPSNIPLQALPETSTHAIEAMNTNNEINATQTVQQESTAEIIVIEDDDVDEDEEKILEPFTNLLKMGFKTSVPNPLDPAVILIQRPVNKPLKIGLRFFGPDGETVVIKAGQKFSKPYRMFSKGANQKPAESKVDDQNIQTKTVEVNEVNKLSPAETARVEKQTDPIEIKSRVSSDENIPAVAIESANPAVIEKLPQKGVKILSNICAKRKSEIAPDINQNRNIQNDVRTKKSKRNPPVGQEIRNDIQNVVQTENPSAQQEVRKDQVVPQELNSEQDVTKEVQEDETNDNNLGHSDALNNKLLPALPSSNNDSVNINDFTEILEKCPLEIRLALQISSSSDYKKTRNCLLRAIEVLREDQNKELFFYKLLMNQCHHLRFCYLTPKILSVAKSHLTADDCEFLNEVWLLLEIKYYSGINSLNYMFTRMSQTETAASTINVIMREANRIEHHSIKAMLLQMTDFKLTKDKLSLIYIALHDIQYTHGNKVDTQIMGILTKKGGFSKNSRINGLIYNRVAEPEEVAPITVNADVSMNFRQFRYTILNLIGIHISESNVKKVRNFMLSQTSLHQILQSGPALLRKYNNQPCKVTIVKIVLAKYWQFKQYDQIKNIFETMKATGDPKTLRLVTMLRLLYNIKYNIEVVEATCGKDGTAENKQETLSFVNTSELDDVLNFLENLANERNQRISLIFEYLINDPEVNQKRKIYIAYAYKVYALKLKNVEIMSKAEGIYRKFNGGFETFHYEATLQTLIKMPIPFDITEKYYNIDILKALTERYLAHFEYSFMVCLHVIWIYYLKKLVFDAREVKWRCSIKLRAESEELYFKFMLVCAILEANHGDNKVAITEMFKLMGKYGKNMNYICTLSECYLLCGNLDKARTILLPALEKPEIILDPEVQKTVFIYSINWDLKINGSTIAKMLTPQKRKFDHPPRS